MIINPWPTGRKRKHHVILPLPSESKLLTLDEVEKRLKIKTDIPSALTTLVYLSQPRGCSTAIGAAWGNLPLLAGNVHYQPIKYLQRYASSLEITHLDLLASDQTYIAIKETPGGPNYRAEEFDTLSILARAGIPIASFRAIVALRHPFIQFDSWLRFDTRRQANVFLSGQTYLINKQITYQQAGIKAVPFVVELFHGQDAEAMRALFTVLDLPELSESVPDNLVFKPNGVIWHEADPRVYPYYYETVIADVIKTGKFQFPKPTALEALNYLYTYTAPSLQQKFWSKGVPQYINYARYASDYLHKHAGFRNRWFEEDYLPSVISQAKQHGA